MELLGVPDPVLDLAALEGLRALHAQRRGWNEPTPAAITTAPGQTCCPPAVAS